LSGGASATSEKAARGGFDRTPNRTIRYMQPPLRRRYFSGVQMSVQAIAWALSVKAGSPAAKAVLLALANYANEHGTCWPSQRRLAEDTEQSVDSVRRYLKLLERRELIVRTKRFRENKSRRADLVALAMATPAPPSNLPGPPLQPCQGLNLHLNLHLNPQRRKARPRKALLVAVMP
jgi:hypothetical protein